MVMMLRVRRQSRYVAVCSSFSVSCVVLTADLGAHLAKCSAGYCPIGAAKNVVLTQPFAHLVEQLMDANAHRRQSAFGDKAWKAIPRAVLDMYSASPELVG